MEEIMEKAVENTVETAYENLQKAAEQMDTAVAAQKALDITPAVSSTGKTFGWKNFLIGAGISLGSGVAGFAIDRWGIPAVKKGLASHKEKRAKKKAEKEAKKAAKQSGQTDKAASKPAPEDLAADPGFDPRNIDTKID